MPSTSVEDYLKALYKLEQRNDGRIKTTQIAEELEVSLPSVTNMLKVLEDQGYVERVPYRGASLTESGTHEALKVIRSHRLIEVFLTEHLGYSWDEVHPEAERLEHAMSDRFTNRLDALLGHPRWDPHGDPIPDPDGSVERRDSALLPAAEIGTVGTISRVLDQSSDVLQYLDSRGIRPGVSVEVTQHDPFDGPVWLRVNGEDVPLSRSLAARLLISDASDYKEDRS